MRELTAIGFPVMPSGHPRSQSTTPKHTTQRPARVSARGPARFGRDRAGRTPGSNFVRFLTHRFPDSYRRYHVISIPLQYSDKDLRRTIYWEMLRCRAPRFLDILLPALFSPRSARSAWRRFALSRSPAILLSSATVTSANCRRSWFCTLPCYQ